jgi:Protein of unknown function (DUF1064)
MAYSKYKAKPQTVDGHRFASQLEARRYQELRFLERTGEITGLVLHPRFHIRWPGEPNPANEICIVELDFMYYHEIGKRWHYEDTKGVDTALSRLKRKLVKAMHDIDVELIGARQRWDPARVAQYQKTRKSAP